MTITQRPPERVAADTDRSTKKRRRPSGEPPPLPRSLRSGKYWIGLMIAGGVSWIGLALVTTAGATLTRFDVSILEGIAQIRTEWLTRVMRSIDALGSEWVVLVLRWGVVGPHSSSNGCAIYSSSSGRSCSAG